MRNGWPVSVKRTSLAAEKKTREHGPRMREESGHGPNHANGVAEDGDEVGRDVGHGRVRIGKEHLIGDLDGPGDPAFLSSRRPCACGRLTKEVCRMKMVRYRATIR